MRWLILGAVLVGRGVAVGQTAVVCDEAWDAVFTRASGWTGGDIGHSIDLGDGRTLWLFGDSIVGPVRDGARVGDASKFVRGAIGWHETPGAGGAPAEVSFAIPEAFGGVPVVSWASSAPELFGEGAWYWLMGDGEVVRDAAGARRFVLFVTAIGPAGNPEGMWNFRQLGGAVLTVRDMEGPPNAWSAEQAVHPLVGESARFGEAPVRTENWGIAVVAWSGEGAEGGRTLYVYGVRSDGPGDNQLVLARCEEDDLDQPAAWEFRTAEGWSGDRDAAEVVARDVAPEFTVEVVALAAAEPGQARLVLVQSEPMLGRHILVRTADSPEGPWSEPVRVFEVAEVREDARLMTYAAKGHAALSREGELLVSYAVNSTDFGRCSGTRGCTGRGSCGYRWSCLPIRLVDGAGGVRGRYAGRHGQGSARASAVPRRIDRVSGVRCDAHFRGCAGLWAAAG